MPATRVKPSLGCGYVVAVLLLAGGVALIGLAASRHSANWHPTADIVVPAVLGMALVVGAICYVRLARRVVREFAEGERRRIEFPGQPWKWRKEWLGPYLESKDASGVGLAWFLAIAVNAISFPVAYAIVTRTNVPPPAYLALIFPVIGLAMAGAAIHKTLQFRKYGRTRFVPSVFPGAIGGYLGGVIQVPARFRLEQDACLTLRCICRETTRGQGSRRHVRETVLWEHEERIPVDRWNSDAAHTAIPVLFHIPPGQPATELDDPARQVIWRLAAEAPVAGVDFATTFDVPVFATGETISPPPPTEPVLAAYRGFEADAAELRDAGIVRQRDGWRFTSGHLWVARTVSLFLTLGLAGLLVFFVGRDVHWVAWVTTGVFFGFGWLITADLWAGPCELELRGDELIVRQRRRRGGWERRVARTDVAEIRAEKSIGLGTKQFHRLVLVGRGADLTKPGLDEPFRARKLRYQLAQLGQRGSAGAEQFSSRREELLAKLAVAPSFEIVFARHVPGPRLVESVRRMILAQIRGA